MSTPILTAASWISFLAGTTAAERAAAWAAFNVNTIEFLDGSGSVIRTITCGAWTVGAEQGGYYPVIPGVYTDSGVGAGTPVTAVFKTGSTEKWRCSCGTEVGSFYLLRANIVANVPIVRGGFGVLVGPPPVPAAQEPINTAAPTLTGIGAIGNALTLTPGTWTGNPVPSVVRQWYRGASPISGQTGLTYTLVSADLGAVITVVETASNSQATKTATTNTIGPITNEAFNVDSVPSPIPLPKDGTFDFASVLRGGNTPYTVAIASGVLPANVVQSSSGGHTGNLLTATGATVALSADIGWTASDTGLPAATLPAFKLTSVAGGSNLPFTMGHVFKQGDVPAGKFVDSSLADWQYNVLSYWPDGSHKRAVISGRIPSSSAGVQASMALTVSNTNRAGSALTESALAAAAPALSIAFSSGVTGTVNLASLIGVASTGVRGSAGRIQNRVSGPVMSEWKYYSPVGADPHMAVYVTARLYTGGRTWFRVTVENGWWNVAAPTGKTYNCTITLGSTTIYTGTALDHRHHTRWSMEFWHGGDPQWSAQHDNAYLRATKLVPNFIGNPSNALLSAFSQTYTPFAACDLPITGMGAGGAAKWFGLLPEHDAAAAASNDIRAWKAMIANGHAYGMYGVHYRDETTLKPVVPHDYPDWVISNVIDGVADTGNYGAHVTPAPSGTEPNMFAPSHHPAPPYLAALLTGDDFYTETVQMTSAVMSFADNAATGWPGDGRMRGSLNFLYGGQTRDEAWRFRTLFLAAAISAPGSVHETSFKQIIADNMQNLKDTFIDGTNLSGEWVNNLGVLSAYLAHYNDNPAQGWEAPWQYCFLIASLGFGSDLGIALGTTEQANLIAVRNFGYKWPAGRTDAAGGWCFRRAGTYSSPITYNATGTLNWIPSHAAAWAEYTSFFPALTTDCTPGATLFYPGGNNEAGDAEFKDGSSWSSLWPALAYAVDHGAPGAADGWGRISGSSTWAARVGIFNEMVRWGVVPR